MFIIIIHIFYRCNIDVTSLFLTFYFLDARIFLLYDFDAKVLKETPCFFHGKVYITAFQSISFKMVEHKMVLNIEIDKIDYYIEELIAAQSTSDKGIYEKWEIKHKPMPFIIMDSEIDLVGVKIKIPESTSDRIGDFHWDTEINSAVLCIESGEEKYKYSIQCDNGKLAVKNLKSDEKKIQVSHGEILEVIYDIINHSKKDNSTTDILSLTKKDFLKELEAVTQDHDNIIISEIKKMPLTEIRDFLKKASADMALDELSSQLNLGLDGHYAVGNDEQDNFQNISTTAIVPERTRWEIFRELNFLTAASIFKTETEKTFALTFKSAEIMGITDKKDISLKIACDSEAPLNQGDILHVKIRAVKDFFGTFKVDLFDGPNVFGRLRCDSPDTVQKHFPTMFATLPKNPSEFIASCIGNLRDSINHIDSADFSEALEAAIGTVSFSLNPSVKNAANAPANLDKSQALAWSAAVNSFNPIVLIQGPPGTGKTFVLEQVLRQLCSKGLRVLTAAPSNTAVDNICRRLSDMPLLRFGNNVKSIAPDIAEKHWIGQRAAVDNFVEKKKKFKGGIYAGTNVGLLKDQIIADDMKRNGRYDVIVFDEAGMSNFEEFLLCANIGKRAVLFGDHQQLPPFPLSAVVQNRLKTQFKAIPESFNAAASSSAMEYLAEQRKIPVIMLQHSYRCQNPKLLRFSSTLFYNARVRTSCKADYYKLPYHERKRLYPASSMRLYSTSSLPEEQREEQLCFDGHKPGLSNKTEALICADIFYKTALKYPLNEISIIAPYRKQVKILREIISLARLKKLAPEKNITDEQWRNFIFTRIATVDSFQGGESDVVIICYVRSNKNSGIGFIDNPNRINVAHTRCRREMHIIGDIECLKRQEKSKIFERLEKAFRRDGEIINISKMTTASKPSPEK